MKTRHEFGVFDIMGPIMLGPSSSHTGGATRIGLIAGQLCGSDPAEIRLSFYGSLASTYRGHKTDVGIVGGILGIPIDNERIRDSLAEAERRGIAVSYGTAALKNAHPNTVVIGLTDRRGRTYTVRGYTVGGGLCAVEEIDGIPVEIDGKKYYALLRLDRDGEAALEDLRGQGLAATLKAGSGGASALLVQSAGALEEAVLQRLPGVTEVQLFRPVMDVEVEAVPFFASAQEMAQASAARGVSVSELVIRHEMRASGLDRDAVLEKMGRIYDTMQASVRAGVETPRPLLGHTFEGGAQKMTRFLLEGRSLCSASFSNIVRDALSVMEVNGSMGRVATCPTAGSCGVLPAALLNVARQNGYDRNAVVETMFTAAGVGILIARDATISGAVGGCQAEVGSASAMAAAAIAALFGGTAAQIYSAAAMALGNLLGLVCDPVAGMVELPCIQRNAAGALNAVACAEMALSGVESVVSLDEVISSMREVGDLMHGDLKDTLRAGLSNTGTARNFEQHIFGHLLGGKEN